MNMLILNRKRLLDLLVLEHFLFPNPSIGKSKKLPNIARPPAGGGVAHTDGDSAPSLASLASLWVALRLLAQFVEEV